jgi:pyruvate dehydrogenase E2 component (dihydrolipoamide acetyltransferase)
MPADGATATETARGTVERVEPTKAQRAFARRVAESKATAPHIYLEADLGTDAVERVVAAAAKALREFPRLNGAYRDGAFETYSRINVGVTIEADETPAVPTVFDADQKEESEIRGEIERLREGAAAGSLTPPELAGGTFTVVPVAGGVRSFAPILHQGQAATLAVTASAATLACDARIVTAGEAAQFLDRVRALLETGE